MGRTPIDSTQARRRPKPIDSDRDGGKRSHPVNADPQTGVLPAGHRAGPRSRHRSRCQPARPHRSGGSDPFALPRLFTPTLASTEMPGSEASFTALKSWSNSNAIESSSWGWPTLLPTGSAFGVVGLEGPAVATTGLAESEPDHAFVPAAPAQDRWAVPLGPNRKRRPAPITDSNCARTATRQDRARHCGHRGSTSATPTASGVPGAKP